MEFRILGPLEAIDEGRPLALPSGKPRALLATLLLHAGEAVSVDRLIDELWGERPTETAARALQVYVSRLRKALGADVVRHRPPGYAIDVDPSALDLTRFEELVADARSLPPAEAAGRLREALALWRGEPEIDRARLDELRLGALEDRIAADLELGRHAQVVPELESLVREHPLRERLREQLMLALYRSGRQAEALEEHRRAREALVEELGIEPGPGLQRLQRAILAQDESLAPPPASRLPVPPARLVGRERELASAVRLVRDGARLVTLTGPGGIGKTRLALELARLLESDVRDGAVVVRLATVLDPALVPDAIAQALGVPEADAATLREHLRTRSHLLLVDNFEQLLPAAPFLSELLEAAPGLRLIVTSRAPLHVAGEQEYEVPPLEEAEELFVACARGVDPAFVPDDAVPAICARLEGLPLAIELAAARVKLLAPAAILERLEHSLDLLTGGRADAPAHQQTLRAAIDWSYRLLDGDERRLFAQLSVFSGGATLAAIEEVCAGELDTLASLVDKSLLRRSGDRFTMLELLREYAAEQRDEAVDVRRAHLAYYLALAERAGERFDLLEVEHANLRAALAFAVERREAAAAARLAAALARFWRIHGHLVEARRALETVLALDGDAPLEARQRCHNGLGIMLAEQGEFSRAEPAFTAALELARELRDDVRAGMAYANLGNLAAYRRDYEEARRLFAESVEMHVRAGHARGRVIGTANLGGVAFCEGDLAGAGALLTAALSLAREIGERREEAAALRMLARVRLESSELAAAERFLGESVAPAREVGDRHGIADALDVAGAAAAARGRGDEAAVSFGAADALRAAIGATRQPDVADWYDRVRAGAQRLVSEEDFAAALERGRGLHPEDAAALLEPS